MSSTLTIVDVETDGIQIQALRAVGGCADACHDVMRPQ